MDKPTFRLHDRHLVSAECSWRALDELERTSRCWRIALESDRTPGMEMPRHHVDEEVQGRGRVVPESSPPANRLGPAHFHR